LSIEISSTVKVDLFHLLGDLTAHPSNYMDAHAKEFIQFFSFFLVRAQMNRFIAKRAKNRQPPSTGL
jgi:hypothetical protein